LQKTGFLLPCKKLWYVKLAQLKVELLNEEDGRENTLLGGRREGLLRTGCKISIDIVFPFMNILMQTSKVTLIIKYGFDLTIGIQS
jgi:hypothetical protein